MNTAHQFNGTQYLIRYTIKGGWANIEEVVIPATCVSAAERIFASVYKGCQQVGSPRRVG